MTEVIPAIIPENLEDLYAKADRVRAYVNTAQVDIMDGKFAPVTSWPYNNYEQFEDLVKEGKPLLGDLSFELDMMVERPEDVIGRWMELGAKALIIHVDSTNMLENIIPRAKERRVAVGIALRPDTDNDVLERWIPDINFVQFMGNQKIGYHGVELDDRVLQKITKLRKTHPKLSISVDIGVNFETAPSLIKAGATKLVSGSTIFNAENINEAIEKLKNV
ncbi:hypothetical protein IIB51_00510 [Patescibacteria group bacterium]|nr:hypothetical protein [Patescibacteria group bacterium]